MSTFPASYQARPVTAVDIVDDLIKRGRLVRELAHLEKDGLAPNAHPWVSRFPGVSDEDLLLSVEAFLAEHARQPKLLPSHGTTLACTKCARLGAPAYYLKRSHGRYAVLCFDNGNGCWEHSSHANCSYVDQHSSQCMDLAEWVVAYGPDMLKERQVCSMHVPAVLSDATEHRVFALED